MWSGRNIFAFDSCPSILIYQTQKTREHQKYLWKVIVKQDKSQFIRREKTKLQTATVISL